MVLVNVFDARNQFSALVRLAMAGEEIIVTRRGSPVARLVPFDLNPPDTTAQEVPNHA